MGRPPCCDKIGVKKGPWTPEEDIMLVTYLQEHGPGNWRAVPTNTGLRRCSKSCRLRWTNYLRPGIKRGSFNDHEEKLIIQLQALLGNKWAAIASYLPERTDNDIKNFWNTHLKKKLNNSTNPNPNEFSASKSISKGQWERRLQGDISTAKQALHEALSLEKTSPSLPGYEQSYGQYYSVNKPAHQTTTYASSTENIARLLKGWMKNSKSIIISRSGSTISSEGSVESKSCGLDLSEAYENLFGFESFESSSSEVSPEVSIFNGDGTSDNNVNVTNLSMVENWLLEDSNINGKDDLTTSFSCFYEAVNLF